MVLPRLQLIYHLQDFVLALLLVPLGHGHSQRIDLSAIVLLLDGLEVEIVALRSLWFRTVSLLV